MNFLYDFLTSFPVNLIVVGILVYGVPIYLLSFLAKKKERKEEFKAFAFKTTGLFLIMAYIIYFIAKIQLHHYELCVVPNGACVPENIFLYNVFCGVSNLV